MNVASRSVCTGVCISITQRCYEHIKPQNPKVIDELLQRVFKEQAQSRQSKIDAKTPENAGTARVSGNLA